MYNAIGWNKQSERIEYDINYYDYFSKRIQDVWNWDNLYTNEFVIMINELFLSIYDMRFDDYNSSGLDEILTNEGLIKFFKYRSGLIVFTYNNEQKNIYFERTFRTDNSVYVMEFETKLICELEKIFNIEEQKIYK